MKKIYVGGGFIDVQLLWLIPFLDGYCKKKNIKTIIFERKFKSSILNNSIINKILNKYNILYLKNDLIIKNIIFFFFYLLCSFLKILFYAFLTTRVNLLNKKYNWTKIQILHSIWDSSVLSLKNYQLEPNFLVRIKFSFLIHVNLYLAKFLAKQNLDTVFFGHTVYSARAMIAFFRERNIKIICHANSSLYVLPKSQDISWSMPDIKVLKRISMPLLFNKSLQYWKKRVLGNGNYEEANIAAKKKFFFFTKKNTYKNIIMLHIFRDSPFHIIDRSRIFADYIDWIKCTLKILQLSKENWLIRPHPNCLRWGENSKKLYFSIINKYFSGISNKNVKFDNLKFSNIELLKNAKRIITYSGTAHLEAACLGIKPIIISNTTLNHYDKNIVFKPKTIKEYSDLLLKNSKSFKLNKKQIMFAKFILFFNENISHIRKVVNSRSLYRNDKVAIFKKEFLNTTMAVKNKNLFLYKLGNMMAFGFRNIVTEKYLTSDFIKNFK
jgi:hypothetical protein